MGGIRERTALFAGGILVVAALIATLFWAVPSIARSRIQILAHRGASAYAPENTLASFKLAIEQRADWLEFDIQQTRDGQLVVFHDLRLERTTNGQGSIRDVTLDQLRALDAGAWFDQKFAGERVPTFDEVVQLARDSGTRIFPEVKEPRFGPGMEERVVAVLRKYNYEDMAIVQSFDERSLDRLHALSPTLRLALLYTRENPWRGAPPSYANVLGPEWSLVAADRDATRSVQATGRQVVAWTVDTPQAARQMIDARVDGIITNKPDMVRAMLDRQ